MEDTLQPKTFFSVSSASFLSVSVTCDGASAPPDGQMFVVRLPLLFARLGEQQVANKSGRFRFRFLVTESALGQNSWWTNRNGSLEGCLPCGSRQDSPCSATAFPGDVTEGGWKLGHLRHHHGDRMASSVGNPCLDTSVWLDFCQQESQVACYAGVSTLRHWAEAELISSPWHVVRSSTSMRCGDGLCQSI